MPSCLEGTGKASASINRWSASSCRGCGALRQLALQCPSLRSVDATFCGSLTDDALVAAVRGLPSLQTLLLAVRAEPGPCTLHCRSPGGSWVGVQTLLMLHWLNFTTIHVTFRSLPCMIWVSDRFTPLRQVCNGITARGMAALSDLRRLRVLELSYTEIQVRYLK